MTLRTSLLFLFAAFLVNCSSDPLVLDRITVPSTEADVWTEITPGGTDQNDQLLLASHEDIHLRLSYLTNPAGRGELVVYGNYALDLRDLSIDGAEPITPAEDLAGSWHDLEVIFKAPGENNPALLSAVYLDGALMHFNRELPAGEDTSRKLAVMVREGNITLADVDYLPSAGRTSTLTADGAVDLNVPLLRYERFPLPGGVKSVDDFSTLTADRTGFIQRFDLHAISPETNYAVRFSGTLDIPADGQYAWRTFGPGAARLILDGRTLIDQEAGKWRTQDSSAITAGTYPFVLEYVHPGGWNKFDLAYRFAGEEERYLNTMEEQRIIAKPAGPNVVEVQADDRPYLLRSFVFFPAPKMYEVANKRTHALSVGEGEGPHYTVDLQSGALLQVWRGGFADVQQMWVGRGEPQTMSPLGPVRQFGGAVQFAGDIDLDEGWPVRPEDPSADDYYHIEHTLDEAGRPTFVYAVDDHQFSDHLAPTSGGLAREITHAGGVGADGYTVLAAARVIQETAPGKYALRGPGMELNVTSYDGEQLYLIEQGGQQLLVAAMRPNGHVRYNLTW